MNKRYDYYIETTFKYEVAAFVYCLSVLKKTSINKIILQITNENTK